MGTIFRPHEDWFPPSREEVEAATFVSSPEPPPCVFEVLTGANSASKWVNVFSWEGRVRAAFAPTWGRTRCRHGPCCGNGPRQGERGRFVASSVRSLCWSFHMSRFRAKETVLHELKNNGLAGKVGMILLKHAFNDEKNSSMEPNFEAPNRKPLCRALPGGENTRRMRWRPLSNPTICSRAAPRSQSGPLPNKILGNTAKATSGPLVPPYREPGCFNYICQQIKVNAFSLREHLKTHLKTKNHTNTHRGEVPVVCPHKKTHTTI